MLLALVTSYVVNPEPVVRSEIESHVDAWLDRVYPKVMTGKEGYPSSIEHFRYSEVVKALSPHRYERLVDNWCDNVLNGIITD